MAPHPFPTSVLISLPGTLSICPGLARALQRTLGTRLLAKG